jgi:endoglucanase
MGRSRNNLRRSRVARITRDAAIAAVAVGATVGGTRAALPNVVNAANAIANTKLFVNPQSPARKQADAWRRSRPSDAALLDRIAAQPVATWITGWESNVRSAISGFMSAAAGQAATPVFVAYNIPNRDCGSYSAGGVSNASAYHKWISDFATGLGGRSAVVILEPDAVAGADCLSAAAQNTRYDMLRDAVQVLKNAHATVYLDAGHAGWVDAADMAARLAKAGIAQADGFALNVSNYVSTSLNEAYGDQLSRLVGGKHYVIDTSRNGLGGRGGDWCNVRGQSLGAAPTTHTGRPLVDAYLWIKVPGESDGTCNGGPEAGAWWSQYALELARNDAAQLASR